MPAGNITGRSSNEARRSWSYDVMINLDTVMGICTNAFESTLIKAATIKRRLTFVSKLAIRRPARRCRVTGLPAVLDLPRKNRVCRSTAALTTLVYSRQRTDENTRRHHTRGPHELSSNLCQWALFNVEQAHVKPNILHGMRRTIPMASSKLDIL